MKNRVSLIIIGTELTEGIIQDKHGRLLSKELTHLGYHIGQIVTIPDDGSVLTILRSLLSENDIIILTGGLGPTSDDLTRDAISKAVGLPLKRDEEAFERLYQRVGERVWGANEKQAYFPEGFKTILNPNGTAEGFYGYVDKALLIALPGPPREMEYMLYNNVLPYLEKLIGFDNRQRLEYSTFLIAEAKLEELTKEISNKITWGTRFQDYKISLYASGEKSECKSAIESLKALCGPELIKDGEHTPLSLLREALIEKKLTLSAAESCTGGLASKILTDEAGSSDYFLGGVISYSNEVKEQVLSVKRETLISYGAVSIECAREMAEGVLKLTDSDYSFSITGVAGPKESENKRVGHVCFAFASKYKETQAVSIHFTSYGRSSVRRKSTTTALLLLREYINTDRELSSIVDGWKYI